MLMFVVGPIGSSKFIISGMESVASYMQSKSSQYIWFVNFIWLKTVGAGVHLAVGTNWWALNSCLQTPTITWTPLHAVTMNNGKNRFLNWFHGGRTVLRSNFEGGHHQAAFSKWWWGAVSYLHSTPFSLDKLLHERSCVKVEDT